MELKGHHYREVSFKRNLYVSNPYNGIESSSGVLVTSGFHSPNPYNGIERKRSLG
jgi:hypothetical protein